MQVWRVGLVVICAAALSGCAGRIRQAAPRLPELSEVRALVVPWESAFPNDVALDSLGRVWFTDRITHAIGMVTIAGHVWPDPITSAVTPDQPDDCSADHA